MPSPTRSERAGVGALRRSTHRYLVVGIANTALDLALFTTLAVGLGVRPVVANVVSTVVVMTVSFFLNRGWVFRAADAGIGAYAGFVAVTLFSGLVVQSLVILAVVDGASALAPGVPDDLVVPAAKLAAIAVGMVCNFTGYRWVFGAGRRSPAAAARSRGRTRTPARSALRRSAGRPRR